MLQHVLLAVWIAEGHVPERNIAVKHLPVFLFRLEGVAVFCGYFRRIAHIGLRVEKRCHPLNVDLHVYQIGEHLHQPLNRLHHTLCVVDKHAERTDEHRAAHRDNAALPQNDGKRRRGGKRRCGHKKAPEVHFLHALALHDARQAPEFPFHLFFNHERLRGLRARDAFVEAGGNFGILLAHPAVVEHEFFLEIDARNRQHRHNCHHTQCQPPIEHEHHHNCQRQIRHIPYRLHESPGKNRRNLVGIGHHARVNIADAVLIEIGKRQRLQMVEANPLEVAPDIHFRLAGGKRGDAVRRRLDNHDQNIKRHKRAEPRERPVRNKMVDGILLEQWNDRIHRASDEAQRNHICKHKPAVALEIRKELRNTEPARLFFFHAGSSSPIAICI